jgi:hypothetical protein
MELSPQLFNKRSKTHLLCLFGASSAEFWSSHSLLSYFIERGEAAILQSFSYEKIASEILLLILLYLLYVYIPNMPSHISFKAYRASQDRSSRIETYHYAFTNSVHLSLSWSD